MRALVVANGEPPSRALLTELAGQAGLIVGADGGAGKALAAGISVDAVVGDLDSAGAGLRSALPEGAFHLRDDVNSTDLQKAISFCIEQGCDAIDIVAAGGGRADHALANLAVLVLFRGGPLLRIVDDEFEVELVQELVTIDSPPGTVVSLVAIGACSGITTTGLRWNLDGASLSFSPRGVHNEVAAPPATVTVAEGDLLLFRGRWIEKHA